jgi:hypothetical protein
MRHLKYLGIFDGLYQSILIAVLVVGWASDRVLSHLASSTFPQRPYLSYWLAIGVELQIVGVLIALVNFVQSTKKRLKKQIAMAKRMPELNAKAECFAPHRNVPPEVILTMQDALLVFLGHQVDRVYFADRAQKDEAKILMDSLAEKLRDEQGKPDHEMV